MNSCLTHDSVPANADRSFAWRHLGPRPLETEAMAKLCGFPSLDALVDAAVPPAIRLRRAPELPAAVSEPEALARLGSIAAKNRVCRSFIG
ncbi:MAG: hypothetical protein JNL97_03000, partial [Verrucomicrobiales bacterium]|nr:hypothetical protein [Verrucomicrobiales bacterium]